MVAMQTVSRGIRVANALCKIEERQWRAGRAADGTAPIQIAATSILIERCFLYPSSGSFNLPTFGLMLWLAAVAAAFVVDRAFKRAGIDADAVGMVAIAVVAGIVGAKLWHVLDTPSEFRAIGWGVLWDKAGFAWYGGLIFGISALVLQGWRAKIGALRTLDLAAPAAAIGYGIGRIGCFLSGDGCYGIEITPVHLLGFTFHPWGMAFPNGLEPVSGAGVSDAAL